jgi:hypothetical protein
VRLKNRPSRKNLAVVTKRPNDVTVVVGEHNNGIKEISNSKGGITMKKRLFLKPVGVVFDEDTYDLLVEITTREEVSKSEFIRNAVRETIDKRHAREGRRNEK